MHVYGCHLNASTAWDLHNLWKKKALEVSRDAREMRLIRGLGTYSLALGNLLQSTLKCWEVCLWFRRFLVDQSTRFVSRSSAKLPTNSTRILAPLAHFSHIDVDDKRRLFSSVSDYTSRNTIYTKGTHSNKASRPRQIRCCKRTNSREMFPKI